MQREIGANWPLLLIWAFGTLTWALYPFQCTGDDSWFYNVIGRNLALHGQQSFSGIFATNGVHPLWLYLLTAYTFAVAHLAPSVLNRDAYAVPLSSVLALWGAWNLSRFAGRFELSRLLVAGLPLVFMMGVGLLYSEAHASFAVLSWLLWVSLDPRIDSGRGGLFLGVLVGLAVLARLDSVFFAGAYAAWYLRRVRKAKAVLAFTGGMLVMTVPYLVTNWKYFGSVMPMSGWLKSSFPSMYIQKSQWAGLTSTLCGYVIPFGVAPVLITPLVLVKARKVLAGVAHLAWPLWCGAAGQFVYVAVFTRSHTHWYWYYVLPVILGGVAAGVAWHEVRRWLVGRRALMVSGSVASAVLIAGFAVMMVRGRWGRGMERAPETASILAFIRGHELHGRALLLSDWPGYVAFATDNYVVAADMLTSNHRLYEEMKHSPDALRYLLEYCRRRGRPVEYVFYTGNPRWLVPSDDLRSAALNDPRRYPAFSAIGRLEFGRAPVERIRQGNRTVFAVWQLATIRD